MDYQKIGNFIKELRTEKGLTQKELADELGISNKTISKWETGNGLPDIVSLQPLCDKFDISINDLLSGERLQPSEYTDRAEENIMNLLQVNEKNRRHETVFVVAGFCILISGLFILYATLYGMNLQGVAWYLDAPSLITLVVISTALLLLSGKRSKNECITFLRKTVMPVGFMIVLVQAIFILATVDDPAKLGPNFAVNLITILYSVILYLFLHVIENRNSSY